MAGERTDRSAVIRDAIGAYLDGFNSEKAALEALSAIELFQPRQDGADDTKHLDKGGGVMFKSAKLGVETN